MTLQRPQPPKNKSLFRLGFLSLASENSKMNVNTMCILESKQPKCSRLLVPEKNIGQKTNIPLQSLTIHPSLDHTSGKWAPHPILRQIFLERTWNQRSWFCGPHIEVLIFFFLRVNTRVLASGHADVNRGLPALETWDHTKPSKVLIYIYIYI